MIPPDQLTRLWHAHSARLLLIGRAIGQPAEDAVQEAFIKLGQLDEIPDQPMAWLVRVVRNLLIQWHRSGQRQRRRHLQSVSQRCWFVDQDPTAGLVAAEVSSALQRLELIERQIVVLHVWGELTFEQIASEVGLSRATAHRRFQDAIERLRRELEGDLSSSAKRHVSTAIESNISGTVRHDQS